MESIDERTTHMLGDDEPGGINVRFMGRGIWSLACRVTANTMLRTMRGDQFFPQYGILSGIGLSILACAGLGADPVASQTQPIAKSALQGKHPVNAEDWSQFRGPNGQGVARAQSFPVELDLQRQLVWKVSVPPGNSSPIVLRDGMLVFTANDGGKLQTTCLDPKDGSVRWTRTAPTTRLEPTLSPGRLAAPTPVTDGSRVYAYFGSFGLIAYDAGGREIWQRPLTVATNRNGTASSPILASGRLLQLVDCQVGKSFIEAMDPDTGQTVWHKAHPHADGGWSTPILWAALGGQQLVILSSKRLEAFDPATGSLIWWLGGFPDNAVTVPVIHERLLIIDTVGLGNSAEFGFIPRWKDLVQYDTNGDGKIQRSELPRTVGWEGRTIASAEAPSIFFPTVDEFDDYDINHDGGITQEEWNGSLDSYLASQPKSRIIAVGSGATGDATSKVVWENRKGASEVPSPVVHEGRAYTVRNGGVLTCLEASTGRIVYQERLGANGQYLASPVVAVSNGRADLLLSSEKGVISVVPTGDSFRVVKQVDLGNPISATPVLDGTRERIYYVRTETTINAFASRQ